MTKQPFDNPVLDSPSIEINSKFFNTKSARIKTIATADDGYVVSEPSSPTMTDPQYNTVKVTQSGHVEEWDDTPGAERIVVGHTSGHFVEMSPDFRVTKIFGKDFEIILDDKTLYVEGKLNITVSGDANLLVNGNVNQKVVGDYNLKVNGDMKTNVTGNYQVFAKNLGLETSNNISFRIANEFRLWSMGNLYIDTDEKMQFDLPDNKKPKSIKEPFGLKFGTTLIEPSAHELFINKTATPSTITMVDPTLKYPKDRTK